ncbi:MAG: hypothetical protein QOE70_3297 [Chthoniobacter sp.]|jgi:hypothetical protein|nr:hypothetical protein [Chthoniobacter sp.]
MLTDLARIAAIRAALPPEGLFADKEWLLSPEPFLIDGKLAESLHKLGYRLHLFVRACNELYQRSVSGKQPRWIADYLDRGKPPELVEFSRLRRFRDQLPQVIRPDLILTDEGFTIAELDNVPGGIGLTAWLNQTYAQFGTHDLLGGARSMIDGFLGILGGGGDIVVSDEAATYQPEMRFLARLTGGALRVHDAASFNSELKIQQAKSIYRFFENFDLANVPSAPAIMAAAAEGAVRVTPPFKPYLEEKLWFALFWLRPLREFWRRELGERHFLELQKHIPYTWILDPTPLPQHAVIPSLEIHSWEELKHFSQKQRDLILKISGFSELGWGSRSVTLGSDAPQPVWQSAIAHALESFTDHPYVLQRFHKGRLVEQPFVSPTSGQVETMRGRVRLCPYYFLNEGKADLCGALATICPADKKLLHGMKDAIMVPTAVR